MELSPNTFPLSSTSAFVPDLDAMLSCESLNDVDNIQVSTTKEKARNVAILTPVLSTVIYNLQDLTAKQVLFAIITKLRDLEAIEKAKLVPEPTSENESTTNTVPDLEAEATTIREDTKLAFGDVLLTLWKIAFKGDQVSAVLGLPVHEDDKKRHLNQTSGNINTPESLPTTIGGTSQAPPDMKDWASFMHKVAEAWQQDIARKAKKEENNKDKNKKIWDALPEIQKETILVASTQDDLIKPDSPSDPMLMVLDSGTGAKAQTLLHHILKVSGCIVHLDDGFCVAIKNGLFLSQPTEQYINYYSPAFTPPGKDPLLASNDMDPLRLAEQAAHGKRSQDDINKMTTQTVRFPRCFNLLNYTIKNFSELTKILFGQDSILASTLTKVSHHIRDSEIAYTRLFSQHWWFGAAILDRIHIRVQMYLSSCALGNSQLVNFTALEFDDMLNKIMMGEFITTHPWWLK